jgi:hypothetical protein
MIKNVFIMAIAIAIPQLQAMKTQSPVCFFKGMTNDITDKIANFLSFESEQEFIKRTKTIAKKEAPTCCLKHLPTGELGMGLITAYSPNEKEIALLQSEVWPQFGSINSALAIIDIKKNRLLYKEHFNQKTYTSLAISQCAKVFATTHTELDTSEGLCTDTPHFKAILTIKHIALEKTKILGIHDYFKDPYSFMSPSIAFNKQGTHIIAHYINYNRSADHSGPTAEHMIIPITNDISDILPNKTALDSYFARRMICKKLSNQLTLTKIHGEQ